MLELFKRAVFSPMYWRRLPMPKPLSKIWMSLSRRRLQRDFVFQKFDNHRYGQPGTPPWSAKIAACVTLPNRHATVDAVPLVGIAIDKKTGKPI